MTDNSNPTEAHEDRLGEKMTNLDKVEKALRGKVPDEIADEMIEKLKPHVTKLEANAQLVSALEGDYNSVQSELLANRDDQLHRRTLVRTLFAMVEGAVFAVKQNTLTEYFAERCELSPAEYAMLVEESYDLKKNGQLRASPKFLKLRANIRFALSIYAEKVGGKSFSLDVNGPGWGAFLQAIKIRNRLMHPKSLEDLEVSDSELDCVLKAAKWFNDQVRQLMTAATAEIKQSVNAQVQQTLIAYTKKLMQERSASQQS